MPFNQHPATMPVDVAMRNPVSVWTRGQFPSSRDPGVSRAVPAVIAANPDIARARRYDSRFNYGARRRHSNHNLLAEGGERH